MVYTSCLRSYRLTYNLASYEIKKYQFNPKTSLKYSLVLSLCPMMKTLLILAEKTAEKLKNKLLP